MICEICKRSYPDDGTVIRCICNHRQQFFVSEIQPYDPTWPCTHRGEELGIMDCGCQGSPKVWSCPLYGTCAARKLRSGVTGYINNNGMKVESHIHFCNRCPDRKAT